MSYTTRKSLPGQEFVEEVELILDACKYSVGDFWDSRELTCLEFVTFSQAGSVSVSGVAGWSTIWAGASGQVYLNNQGETIEVTVTSGDDDTIVFDLREAAGGLGIAINIGQKLYLMHSGEADGTCRGYPHDCSTADSYSPTAKRSFIFPTAPKPAGQIRFPGLYHDSCKHKGGEVDVGNSIGGRASLNFRIQDGLDDDVYAVPYPDRRSENGTFFGRMFARHPYFSGRELKHREGYRTAGTFDEPDWIERRYIVDDAKLSNGFSSFNALDPLILTEDKKAKIPVASPARLSAAITGTPVTISYIDAPDYYFGPMSENVYIRIDSEVLYCTVSGAKQLTINTRGYRSESKDHDAGASIQDCVAFQGTHGIDAIVFALENYTNIDPSFIGDYSAVKALLPALEFTDWIISKPMPVIDLLNIIVKLGNLIFYYDEIEQQIIINYIPELEAEAITIDEQNNIEIDSVTLDQNIKNQWTRFSHLWGPVDITKDTEENYAIRYAEINLGLESGGALGEVNELKEFKNMSLTTDPDDSLLGVAYASRVISETATPPKIAMLKINAIDVGTTPYGNLSLGSIINLSTKENQDKDGNPLSELFQVLALSGNGYSDYQVKLRRYQSIQAENVDFVISTGGINYDLSDFYTPAPGNYTIYINPGVEFGSYDTSLPAFTTGSQAAGVSFHIINRGSMLGMGGAGGDCMLAAGPDAQNAKPGQNGGNAFNATVDCTIDNGSGLIWAGGGGTGGGFMTGYSFGYFSAADGGGGGQGYGTALSGFWSNGGFAEVVGFVGRRAPGNISAPGETDGGVWGENGTTYAAAGGIAGAAINSNGNTVTITAGNNDLNIKGRRI